MKKNKNIFCKISLSAVLMLMIFHHNAQTISLQVKTSVPSVAGESSGLEIVNRNSFWTHNDSGGKPELYNFDSTGTLLKTLKIVNATNVDWEEVARDEHDNFYIGDFGNNNNDRKNLVIYKIPAFTQVTTDTVSAEKIFFNYPDQTAFPPNAANRNFDVEAFFVFNNQLYLFTKNRSSPNNGYSKIYRLPTVAGSHTAVLMDSIFTGTGSSKYTQITAADINPSKTTIALLCNDALFLVSDFTVDNFSGGNIQSFLLSPSSQKEGICFLNDNELYITDEFANNAGRKLYYLNLSVLLSTPEFKQAKQNVGIRCESNKVIFDLKHLQTGVYTLMLHDLSGKLIEQQRAMVTNHEENLFEMTTIESSTVIASVNSLNGSKLAVKKCCY